MAGTQPALLANQLCETTSTAYEVKEISLSALRALDRQSVDMSGM